MSAFVGQQSASTDQLMCNPAWHLGGKAVNVAHDHVCFIGLSAAAGLGSCGPRGCIKSAVGVQLKEQNLQDLLRMP